MKFRNLLILQFVITISIYSQPNISLISASFGTVRNLQPEWAGVNNYSLYPEIGLGGELNDSTNFWFLYFNYFDDKISKAPYFPDDVAYYSYKDFGIGLKVSQNIIDFSESYIPILFSISCGISYNIINGKNILNYSYLDFISMNSIYDHFFNLNIGVNINYSLMNRINLFADYTELFLLEKNENSYSDYRNAFRLGLLLKF